MTIKVHELVALCAGAGASADPMAATREVLEKLRRDVGSVERALEYVSGTGGNAGQVFYRSPEMTMLKVCFPNGRRTPAARSWHVGDHPAPVRWREEHALSPRQRQAPPRE